MLTKTLLKIGAVVAEGRWEANKTTANHVDLCKLFTFKLGPLLPAKKRSITSFAKHPDVNAVAL
jgi:hypothetical protein